MTTSATNTVSLSTAMRRLSSDIVLFLAGMQSSLDVNGDGLYDANDSLLVMRYLLGFRGSALTAGVSPGSRSTAQIESHLQGLMP